MKIFRGRSSNPNEPEFTAVYNPRVSIDLQYLVYIYLQLSMTIRTSLVPYLTPIMIGVFP